MRIEISLGTHTLEQYEAIAEFLSDFMDHAHDTVRCDDCVAVRVRVVAAEEDRINAAAAFGLRAVMPDRDLARETGVLQLVAFLDQEAPF